MTTKQKKQSNTTHVTTTNNNNTNLNTNTKENNMTTKTTTKSKTPNTTTKSKTPNATTTTTTPSSSGTTATSPVPPPVPQYVNPPPATANIPAPPPGFVPPKGLGPRSSKPRAAELVVMPAAVVELKNFVDYVGTVGKTAPPQADVVSTFDSASQWAIMRKASALWDKYCAVQEGVAFIAVRGQMATLRPAFDLALKADPTLAVKYPNLATFLGAKAAIAKKAVATKAANKAAVAKGLPPTHGAVGKQRLKAADKAVLAAHPPTLAPAATTTPAAPPAATPSPTPPNVAPATPAMTNGVNAALHA